MRQQPCNNHLFPSGKEISERYVWLHNGLEIPVLIHNIIGRTGLTGIQVVVTYNQRIGEVSMHLLHKLTQGTNLLWDAGVARFTGRVEGNPPYERKVISIYRSAFLRLFDSKNGKAERPPFKTFIVWRQRKISRKWCRPSARFCRFNKVYILKNSP